VGWFTRGRMFRGRRFRGPDPRGARPLAAASAVTSGTGSQATSRRRPTGGLGGNVTAWLEASSAPRSNVAVMTWASVGTGLQPVGLLGRPFALFPANDTAAVPDFFAIKFPASLMRHPGFRVVVIISQFTEGEALR
jgi:hypothetical protein